MDGVVKLAFKKQGEDGFPMFQLVEADSLYTTELLLGFNRLLLLPELIGNLTNLTKLDLNRNSLTSIPKEMGRLSNLQVLQLSGNQLVSLPPDIGNLTNLVYLSLDDNKLESLPSQIGYLKNLTEFHLENNALKSLPSEIGNLSSLESLGLYNNSLRKLPPEFVKLVNLTELRLSNNQIERLPFHFENLKNLQVFTLYNNPVYDLRIKELTKKEQEEKENKTAENNSAQQPTQQQQQSILPAHETVIVPQIRKQPPILTRTISRLDCSILEIANKKGQPIQQKQHEQQQQMPNIQILQSENLNLVAEQPQQQENEKGNDKKKEEKKSHKRHHRHHKSKHLKPISPNLNPTSPELANKKEPTNTSLGIQENPLRHSRSKSDAKATNIIIQPQQLPGNQSQNLQALQLSEQNPVNSFQFPVKITKPLPLPPPKPKQQQQVQLQQPTPPPPQQQQQQPPLVSVPTPPIQVQQKEEDNTGGNNQDGAELWNETLERKLDEVIEIVNRNKGSINWNSNEYGSTSLFLATQLGDKPIIEVLLKAGANPNIADITGATPLFIACEYGFAEIAELLLKSGSDPNISLEEDNASPLYIACEKGQQMVVEILLKVGGNSIDKNKAEAIDDMTPLMIASKNGFHEIVEILLKAGVDKEKVTKRKNSALHIAAEYGQRLVVESLIINGLDKNKQNSDGKTPLYVAIDSDFMDIAELIAGCGGTIPSFWMNTAELKIGKEKLDSLISMQTNVPPSPTNLPPRPENLPPKSVAQPQEQTTSTTTTPPNSTTTPKTNSNPNVTTSNIPRQQATVDDVCNWLEQMNCGDYIEAFRENEINGTALLALTEQDLIDLGVNKIGHKRNILSAIEKAKTALINISLPEKLLPINFNALTETLANSSNSKRSQEFLSTCIPKAWDEMPVSVKPNEKLQFGLTSHQAHVDEELTQVVNVENRSDHKVTVRFVSKCSSKCKLEFNPTEIKLSTNKKAAVEIKLIALCTTLLKIEIPVVCWGKDQTKRFMANLTAEIETQLSTRIDSDDLTLFKPPIGTGGFGTVYRGDFRGSEVAVKILKNQEILAEEIVESFKNEVRMMEKLRNRYIINFIGAVHTLGKLAIVTEFCAYGCLSSAMKTHKFDFQLKLKALLDAAHGMDYLHRNGIMHRDFKPGNLLVVSLEVRSDVVCKLCDFGTTRDINRFANACNITKQMGTPIFMAPEILQGKAAYEKSADVYSYGITMANIANEKVPYDDEPDISGFQLETMIVEGKRPVIDESVPEEFRKIAASCWNGNPNERPSFAEIVSQLEAVIISFK